MNNKILFAGLALIIIIAIFGVIFTKKDAAPEYQVSSPEDVVRQYFTAWNNNNWPDMYATMSDGFKKIEPTAKDFISFRNYVLFQNIEGVKVLSVKETFNNKETAEVEYAVEFLLIGGVKRTFSGTFTLRYRQGDIIPGWKLIHPYGNNIDGS